MLRLKMPAGVCSPELYTLLDDLSREYGHGHLRLTTRQTFQLHGVAKHNLKTVIKVRLACKACWGSTTSMLMLMLMLC